MKKALFLSLFVAILASGLILPLAKVEARSIHDRPFCYLLFWRDDRCDDDDGDYAPAPAPATTDTNPPNNSGVPVSTTLAYSYNRAPVWQPTSDRSVFAGQTLQFTITATDPDSDFLYYSALNEPAGAWFEPTTHTFYWTPGNEQVGNYNVTFSVTDTHYTLYKNVAITVLTNPSAPAPVPAPTPIPVFANNPPQFSGFAPTSRAVVGQLYTYDVNAVDADNDFLTYSLLSAPSGMVINQSNGFIAWVPVANQVGFNFVRVAVSDGRVQITADFQVFTDGAPVANPAPNPRPTPAPVPPPENPAEAPIVFSDIKIEVIDEETVVSWKTNIASGSRVIYDTLSQAEKTRNYTYANATPDDRNNVTDHRVNLGKLDKNTVYYMRVVSKTDRQTAVSQEIAFIQLEGGKVRSLFGASLIDILGPLFNSPWFLWLVIIALGATTFVFWRKHKKASAVL